ncbi:hypothetical protein BD770DRAFT_301842, partial [Pilaira anomala]
VPLWAKAFKQQLDFQNTRLLQLETVMNENAKLRKELEQAKARIAMLERFSVTPTALAKFGASSNASKYSDANYPALPTTAATNLSFAAVASVAKKPIQPKPKRTTSKQRRAAARIFEVSSSNPEDIGSDQGSSYLYVYLPNKYRDRLKDFRNKLKKLGVDNGRVLDINYPARGVVALLIHQDYQEDLTKILTKYKITSIDNFNPLDISHISDPALAHLEGDARIAKATSIHQTRLLRGIVFIRANVRRSVARNFVDKGWISKEQAAEAIE